MDVGLWLETRNNAVDAAEGCRTLTNSPEEMLALVRPPMYCVFWTVTCCEVALVLVIVAMPLTLVRFSHNASDGVGTNAPAIKPASVTPLFHLCREEAASAR